MPEPTNPTTPSTTAPSPSASPVSAAGAAPQPGSPSPSPEVVEPDWGSLISDEEFVESVAASPTPEQPAPEPAPEPAPTPIEPQAPEPVPEGAKPPAQPEGPTPEWRAGMVKQLMPKYAFAPETIEAYNEDPTQVLPQLAATLHTNIIEDVARMIDVANAQILPKILEAQFSQRDQTAALRERERELVRTPYPKLYEADQDVVRAMAKAIAKAHPTSKPADRVRMLAEKVYTAEGWEMPWKSGGAPAPTAPAARPNGYTPVAPGAGGNGAAPRPADNPFSDPELLN